MEVYMAALDHDRDDFARRGLWLARLVRKDIIYRIYSTWNEGIESAVHIFLCFFSMQAYRFSHFCKIKIGCPIFFALPLLPECCTAFFSPVISPAARRSSLKMRSRMHIGTRNCVVNRGESKGSSLARSIEKIFLLSFPSSIRLFPSNQYRPQRCVLFWDFASAPPPCSVDTSVLSLTVSSRAASKRTKASKREV